jgi:hypothetical protein
MRERTWGFYASSQDLWPGDANSQNFNVRPLSYVVQQLKRIYIEKWGNGPEDRSRRTKSEELRQGRARVRTEPGMGTEAEAGIRMRMEVRM